VGTAAQRNANLMMVEALSQPKSALRKTKVPRHSAVALGDRNVMPGEGLAGNCLALHPCVCGGVGRG